MPFADEVSSAGVIVNAHRPEWALEANSLADVLRAATPDTLGVEHIGSTSVPGMAAKDRLDMMIVLKDLENSHVEVDLSRLGNGRRPEPWNKDLVRRSRPGSRSDGTTGCDARQRLAGGASSAARR